MGYAEARVGYVGAGVGGSCRGGVGCIIQGWSGL